MLYLFHLIADLLSTAVVWGFSWLIAIFVCDDRLPHWLEWAGTLDNSMAGDGAWQRIEPGHWAWRVHLPAWVQDKPVGVAGYCYTTVGGYWHLCWVKDIGVWGGVRRCLYWNFGWRLKTYAENRDRLKTEPRAMFVFSPRFAEFAEQAS
jgi:hypothetical protein